MEKIGRREVERVKRPESMLLAQIASFANQDFINRQPMQSYPIPFKFLSAFLQIGSCYFTAAPFSA